MRLDLTMNKLKQLNKRIELEEHIQNLVNAQVNALQVIIAIQNSINSHLK